MPVPPPNAYSPGTKLTVGSHEIKIIKYISEGGFAYVYTCTIEPAFHGSNVACLKRVAVPNKWQLTLLRQEVDAMRRLRGNKHIVSYIDSHASRLVVPPKSATNNEQQYEVFVLMEYCSNNGLIDFMNTRLTNKLTEPEILTIMFEVTIGVAMCHHLQPPLLHRDIKIENVLIDGQGTYKLCDFGSSVPYIPAPKNPQELQTVREDIMNHTTPQYRAPEMIDLSRGFPIDDKSDIWALGCFLYKLCYYTTPFESPNQKSLQDLEQTILGCSHTLRFNDQPGSIFSPRMKNIIKCCLREDPRRRPNAVQLLGEIAQMRGVQIPSVIPYSVKNVKPTTQEVDGPKLPSRPTEKHHLKNNKPADPFSTIDKSKYLKSATVNLPTVGKASAPSRPKSTYGSPSSHSQEPPKTRPRSSYFEENPNNKLLSSVQNYDGRHSKSSTSIQDLVQQAINRSSDDLGSRVEEDNGGTLDFLRSKEEESHRLGSRQNTGGSIKAALKSNLRRISTGNNQISEQNHTTTSRDVSSTRMSKRSSITSIKQIMTGGSYRRSSSSSPEEHPAAITKQNIEPQEVPAKKLSIQRRMQLLLNSKDAPADHQKTAKGYGRFTEVKDSDEIDAINSQATTSEDDPSNRGKKTQKLVPPKIPESLSSRKSSLSVPKATRPRSVSPSDFPSYVLPKASASNQKPTSVPRSSSHTRLKSNSSSSNARPHSNSSTKKIPPKPTKPKHLKSSTDSYGDSRRLSTSSEISVPDIDDLEKQFSKRFPSYV